MARSVLISVALALALVAGCSSLRLEQPTSVLVQANPAPVDPTPIAVAQSFAPMPPTVEPPASPYAAIRHAAPTAGVAVSGEPGTVEFPIDAPQLTPQVTPQVTPVRNQVPAPKSEPKSEMSKNLRKEWTSPPPRASEPTSELPKPLPQSFIAPMNVIDLGSKHPIVLALDCILDNRHDEALRHLQGYDPQSREFLLRILPTLSLVAKHPKLSPADYAALDEILVGMQVSLRHNAAFAINKLVFCESIKGYAIYKPLAEGHEFVAAQADRPGELVQLYVELKNFASEPAAVSPAETLFATRLASTMEVRDDKGQKKWSHRFRPEDLKLVSRTRLNDYYHNYTFLLPPTLPPGSYTLTVEITDETSSPPRTARSAIPFRIKE